MATPRPPHMRFRAELRGEVIDALLPSSRTGSSADGPSPRTRTSASSSPRGCSRSTARPSPRALRTRACNQSVARWRVQRNQEGRMSTTTEVPIADVSAEPDRVRAFPLGNYDRKPMRVISYEWVVREEANGDEDHRRPLVRPHARGLLRAGRQRAPRAGRRDRVVADEQRAAAERALRALQQARVRGVRRAQARRVPRAGRRRPVRRTSCAASTRPAAERTSATCGVRATARRT